MENTTPTDFRVLCSKLADTLHDYTSLYEGHECELVAWARTALAEPVGEEPSDEDVLREPIDVADEALISDHPGDVVSAGRRLLARWGRPAEPDPVAVAEGLPEDGDCDAEGRCWWFTPRENMDEMLVFHARWILSRRADRDTHWLPANVLPMPEIKP